MAEIHVLDSLGRRHGETPDAWPEPINLLRGIAAAPLTAADVPRAIGDYAALFARAGGFDETATISAAVTVCAAAIDDGIRLMLPSASGHFSSARLWTATIGSAGSGKSPSQKAMLAPIYDVHRDLVGTNAKAREAAESAKPAGKSDTAPRVPQLSAFTSDCTIDKLSELLADNPRGILYCVDELDSWLGAHDAFSHDGGSRNRGEWMRLYDGGPHQVDRVRRGSFFVKNWGVSVLTATTPAALSRLSRKLSADGLFARFMPWTVRPMVERDRMLPSSLVDRARRTFEEHVRALYAHGADLYATPIVRLSADATARYEAEESRLRKLTEAAEAIGEGFAAHIAKHVGMLARVALTFHAMSDEIFTDDGLPRHPCAANVSGETMALAIRYMRAGYRHAFAIYSGCLGGGSPLEVAQAMARAILADDLRQFNRREITHRCRAWRAASEWQRLAALRALEDLAWIDSDALVLEHGTRWTVNPNVHTKFADERDRARARRDAVRGALNPNAED